MYIILRNIGNEQAKMVIWRIFLCIIILIVCILSLLIAVGWRATSIDLCKDEDQLKYVIFFLIVHGSEVLSIWMMWYALAYKAKGIETSSRFSPASKSRKAPKKTRSFVPKTSIDSDTGGARAMHDQL